MRISFFIDSVPFTEGVISGNESLGGSESACLGLARALAKRQHDVHIFATKLDESCYGSDHGGVQWHPAKDLYDVSTCVHWDVFVSLRMPYPFQRHLKARLKLLWNQDMLIGEPAKMQTMALSWQMDHVAYVSEYHRKQWEGKIPDLKPLGLVVKNGYDADLVSADVAKRWNKIIHISRPERGLEPLLAMWPELKKQVPEAELHICRYSSMYDAGGWGKICAQYDEAVQAVNEQVGGICYLGELGKPALYRAIAEASVMWYPGIAGFAETSCVAAIESQANGTPFVGSWKGALPETVPSGVLITGDALTPEYQAKSIAAVRRLMEGCRDQKRHYRDVQKAGLKHVENYTYDAVAEQWETMLTGCFQARHDADGGWGVLRSLLHEDDHTAAKMKAEAMLASAVDNDQAELHEIIAFCDKVNAGRDQSPELYGEFALSNPIEEYDGQPRFHQCADLLKDCTTLIDVACGNGAFAIGMARKYPAIKIVGIDYSPLNIERANAFASDAGVADRVTFYCRPVWDMEGQVPDPAGKLDDIVAAHGPFDGLFVGEFLEHVVNAPLLIDTLEQYVAPGALVLYTVPNGPFVELMQRGVALHKGHVHHFEHDDLTAVFGQKARLYSHFWSCGLTMRGHMVGHWFVRYAAHEGGAARPRNYAHRILTQRPKVRLSVGLIAKNAAHDLGRCLESVWPLADEIVIGDTGSTDDTKAIAAQFGAKAIDIPSVQDDPEGFAGARNKVLDATTGDWFLWIDTDEILIDGHFLWQYIQDGGPMVGFMIHQTHLTMDGAPTFDRPVRLFKKRDDIRFYGCVHEQPQQGDCNGDIWPTLDLVDVKIAHTGYLTEDIRRSKMVHRNHGLLRRDVEVNGARKLTKLLWVREFTQMGQMAEEDHGVGSYQSRHNFKQAIALYEQYFSDPANKYHALGRPFYETALQRVAGAMEFDLGLAGKVGGMPKDTRAKNERVWVRTVEDLERITAHKFAEIKKQYAPDIPDVEPVVQPAAEAMTV
jgi:glycosyltransferase involved in cell wall biosynthesis